MPRWCHHCNLKHSVQQDTRQPLDRTGTEGRNEIVSSAAEHAFAALGALAKGASVPVSRAVSTGHETAPPPRFTEGALVKKLEELGIGRPSTYAGIIDVLQTRCAPTCCTAASTAALRLSLLRAL